MSGSPILRKTLFVTNDRLGSALRGILAGDPSNEDLRRWIVLGHHYAVRLGRDFHLSDALDVSVIHGKRGPENGSKVALLDGGRRRRRSVDVPPRTPAKAVVVAALPASSSESAEVVDLVTRVASPASPPVLQGVTSMIAQFLNEDDMM